MSELRRAVQGMAVDPDSSGPRPVVPSVLVLVALGGAGGALLRAAVETAAPPGSGWPWATLSINLAGAVLLGVLLGVLVSRPRRAAVARPLLGTGLLGGLTTCSTFAVETARLAHAGHAGLAAAYAACSLVDGVLLAWWGTALGRRVASRGTGGEVPWTGS